MSLDFLIIGQGLAGSLLAWELMQRDCSVLVLDNGKESASQVAAGLINPVTGMRLVKTSHVEHLLPVAKSMYADLGEYFQQDFYIEKPMLRFLANEQELSYCQKRLNNPDYSAYLAERHEVHAALKTHRPYVEQKQTGFLLTRPLLASLKAFFIAYDSYRQVDFNARDLELGPVLCWQDVNPKVVIFCQGYLDAQNPWFKFLPFQSVKGEILTLSHTAKLPDAILNFGDWLIPLSSNSARVGATFDHENLNTIPTEAAKQQLLDSLAMIVDDLSHAKVSQHQAHVRPCTRDKQPFIGCHPQYPQLAIFNGFGAKGSLQIPWCSRHFADSLLNQAPLTAQCNIRRFYEAG